jgi:signal transduction histidine kinase
VADAEQLAKLRHDLANPLSAILAETQLLLLDQTQLAPDLVESLRQIETMAIRMRTMLRESEIEGRPDEEPDHH